MVVSSIALEPAGMLNGFHCKSSAHPSAWLFLLLGIHSESGPAQKPEDWPSGFSIEDGRGFNAFPAPVIHFHEMSDSNLPFDPSTMIRSSLSRDESTGGPVRLTTMV